MAKALTLNLYYDQSPKAGALLPATFANGQLVLVGLIYLMKMEPLLIVRAPLRNLPNKIVGL